MANDCSKIMSLVEDYKSQSSKDTKNKTLKFIGKMVAKQGVKKAASAVFMAARAGTGAGIVFDLLMPNSIGTGSEAFYDTLKNILEEFDSETPDINILKANLSKLQGYYDMIRIEKEFGINSNCYNSLHELLIEIENEINSYKGSSTLA